MTAGLIGDMINEGRATRDTIITWATALDEPINYWLELAGHDPIPPHLITSAGMESREPSADYAVTRRAAREMEEAMNAALRDFEAKMRAKLREFTEEDERGT